MLMKKTIFIIIILSMVYNVYSLDMTPFEKINIQKNTKSINVNNIILITTYKFNCNTKCNNFDNPRECETIIKVENNNINPYYFDNNPISIEWKKNNPIINITYSNTLYTHKSTIINESCISQSFNTSKCTYIKEMTEPINFNKKIPLSLTLNKPLYIKLNWIENNKNNHFNITLKGNKFKSSENIKLDPTITACTDINNPGYYILDNDITSATDKCINITTSNVTIDCNGHSINDTSADKLIYMTNTRLTFGNITIKNCKIKGNDYVTYFHYTTNITIDNVTIDPHGGYYGIGLYATYISNLTIKNSFINGDYSHYAWPLELYPSSSTTGNIYVVNTTLGNRSSQYGLYYKGYSQETIFKNVTWGYDDTLISYDSFAHYYDSCIQFDNVRHEDDPTGYYWKTYDNNQDISSWTNISLILACGPATELKNYTFPTKTRTFGEAIILSRTPSDFNISNINIPSTYNNGLTLTYHGGAHIFNSIFNTNDYNIYMYSSYVLYNYTINNNTFSGSTGIYARSTDNYITKNNIFENSINTIKLDAYSNKWKIYNNLFNTSSSDYGLYSYDSNNYINTTLQFGERIYNNGTFTSNEIGGNFYVKPDGTGYSVDCDDNNKNGFCDTPYSLNSYDTNTPIYDNLTLSNKYAPINNPYWSNNKSSGTDAGTDITFSVLWNITDGANSNLTYYTFSMYNGTNWNISNISNDLESSTITDNGQESTSEEESIFDDFETDWGNWTQSSDDDGDWWIRDSGGTPSSSTGPSSGADSSTYYVYVETSSGSCYNNGDITIIYESPVIDFNSGTSHKIHWWNNMYGSSIGTLELQENTSSSWTTLWSMSGDQGSSWFDNTTDLSSLTGQGNLRFKYTCAGSYRGDAAIDQINISWNITNGGNEDANLTAHEYADIYQGHLFENITKLNVTLHVTNYDNSGSLSNSNNNPDLYLQMYNGTNYEDIGRFYINSLGNYTIDITSQTIKNSWSTNTANRDLKIVPIYFDYYDTSTYDNISYNGLWIASDSNQEWFNFTPINFTSLDCVNGNMSLCWSNVTKKVSETVGDLIKWKIWANTSANLENTTDEFAFLTTTPVSDTCTYSGSGQWDVDCSDNCDFTVTDVLDNIIKISGVGKVKSIANIKNFTAIFINNGCLAYG